MNGDTPSDRQFFRVLQNASAFSLGSLAAFLESLKAVNPEVRFVVSTWTGVAFVWVAALTWLFWRWLPGQTARPVDGRRGWMLAGFAVVALAGTLFSFAYGLKDLAPTKLREVAGGTALAAFFLGVAGLLLWRVAKFLQADAAAIKPPSKDAE